MPRNSGSDSGALWQIVKMGTQWRKTSRRPMLRSLYLAVFAGLHLAAFAVAGIFSAKITGTNSKILLCSDHILTSPRQFQYLRVDAAVSANHIATCFLNTSSTPVNYDSYVRNKPSWKLSEEESCPFADEMCYGAPGTSASKISVHLDSGPIDSTLDLVINAPPQDRVTLQRLLKLFRAALSLPPNQWELGVESWFATGLAALQRRISNADGQWMCENQITHRTDYASFSVLGLFLIILPGLVIIRITLTLVSVVHRLQPNTELNAIRQLEWERTETLELQRQLFAAKGVDIEAVSENGRHRINGTDVESPYTTKSEAPTGLSLDSSGGKQGVSAHYAEVDESRSTSAFEPVDQGDDIADPINRYANNPEDHEMTRLGSGSSRYRRLL
ncbi:hypothetical protein LTR91_022430 [Friedmanniomyces endolithicus]|uniref:Uncharacterized protein n=1 Tax=Friedmanniomyces endolithicus TaxID=329885 RepID=A0AAN6JYP1_9PEZI|nr:hypothetical protein LTR91_022430 [Friedmanniomyces endolithicus]